MFTRRINLIECDEGFSIEILGRVGMKYTEGPKTMNIDSEVLVSPGIAIWINSIRAWDPPYDQEKIDVRKRNQIIENIRRALKSQGEYLDDM